MTESPERRRYRRVKSSKQLLVVWKLGTQKYVSTVENLGLGGLFIRTENPPKAGTTMRILFDTPEGEVRALVAVRNCSPGQGMGVSFVSMDPEDRTRLDRWLRKLLAQQESPIACALKGFNVDSSAERSALLESQPGPGLPQSSQSEAAKNQMPRGSPQGLAEASSSVSRILGTG